MLDYAKATRAHGFTCIAASVFNEADAANKRWMKSKIDGHPSRGKTIK